MHKFFCRIEAGLATNIIAHMIQRQFATIVAKKLSDKSKTKSGNYKFWRRLTMFVAFPAVGFCMVNALINSKKDHVEPRKDYVKYDYLCKRDKRFPWGDGNKTLFHNPKINPLPDGFEN